MREPTVIDGWTFAADGSACATRTPYKRTDQEVEIDEDGDLIAVEETGGYESYRASVLVPRAVLDELLARRARGGGR